MTGANCPCGKPIDGNRHVCKSCWDAVPASLKTNYVFWQSRPDSALFLRAARALTEFCEMYVKDRGSYSIEPSPGLIGKLKHEEQVHLARLLERRAHLRARLHASPDFNPYDQAEAQSLEWVIRKLERLVLRVERPIPPPVNNHQPPVKPLIAPASIEEGERMYEELTVMARQISHQGGQAQQRQQEIATQRRELKAWVHTQRRQQGAERQLQQARRKNMLTGHAFKLLSEAIAADGKEALIALYDDAKGIRMAFHQMAKEFLARQEAGEEGC